MAADGAPPANPRLQATIGTPFACEGTGLHTGERVTVEIAPAPAGHGVAFRRTVKGVAHDVEAIWTNRRSRPLCTALQAGDGPLVRTVEHLMAALSALRIDNVLVSVDAEELPIFDGSAAPWIERLEQAGRREQDLPRRYIRVLKRLDYRDGANKQRVEPQPFLSVYAAVTLSHFGQLRWEGRVDPETFARELAASRSFGRFRWAVLSKIFGRFQSEPLLRGATFGNTAALWGRGAIGGLRWPDEPVRHRALDVVGDYALAGRPLLARISAIRPGHEHNHAMVATLMSDPEAWDLVEIDESGAVVPVAGVRAA